MTTNEKWQTESDGGVFKHRLAVAWARVTYENPSVLEAGIPTKTVLQYARDGRLPCIRIGKHVRFRVSDIESALHATGVSDAPK